MTWHRSDDGFPEHPKSDALAEHFGDDWATCAVAFMTWHHMGCDCASRRTDGVFNAARAHRVVRAPREVIDRALAGLLKVGFLDKHRDGFVFHDWAEYQPTRSELDAERAAKTARQARWRAGKSSKVDGRETPKETGCSARVDGAVDASTTASVDAPVDGAPSRPVPTRPEGETASLLSPAPPAPPTLPLALTPPEAPAEKPARAKRPKADRPPPPFSVADALGAIASTAGRRFVPGDATTWTGGWKIALAQHVRRFPDLATWRLVGEWLAQGGASWAPTHGAQWAASNHLVDAIAKAQAWAANGRGVVDAKAAVVAPMVAPPAVPAFVPTKGPVMVTDPVALERIRERNRRAREEDGLP